MSLQSLFVPADLDPILRAVILGLLAGSTLVFAAAIALFSWLLSKTRPLDAVGVRIEPFMAAAVLTALAMPVVGLGGAMLLAGLAPLPWAAAVLVVVVVGSAAAALWEPLRAARAALRAPAVV